MATFGEWYEWAAAVGVPDPAAVVVATADAEGHPSARHVLVRGFDERGFRFFTNYESRKGRQLAANPFASLVFPWSSFGRQATVEGPTERVTAQESDAYWATRPRGSQLAAIASSQSRALPDRDTLERRYAEVSAAWEGRDVERPDHWGGYRVLPLRIEFWEGRPNRLHDRVLYRREAPDAPWIQERLNP